MHNGRGCSEFGHRLVLLLHIHVHSGKYLTHSYEPKNVFVLKKMTVSGETHERDSPGGGRDTASWRRTAH